MATTINIVKFTTGGTYTPSAGMYDCIIECWGGGGGGGGISALPSVVSSGAATGGGSGAYSLTRATSADIGASKSVLIGEGGPGGTVDEYGVSIGQNGGLTSVGTLCAANGGEGGNGNYWMAIEGGAGGSIDSGSVGNKKAAGCDGSSGISSYYTTAAELYNGYCVGGIGGGSAVGTPGLNPMLSIESGNSVVKGADAIGYSAGGGGAAFYVVTPPFNGSAVGGDGAPGFVLITESITT